MLRDIHAVSSSWNRRADDPDDMRWPESNDYVSAVAEWNFSLQQTLKFKERYPDLLLIVEFERFYCGDPVVLENILHKLALSAPDRMLKRFQAMTSDWERRSKEPLCKREGHRLHRNACRYAHLHGTQETRGDSVVVKAAYDLTRRRWSVRRVA
jgi:hypothetical protein